MADTIKFACTVCDRLIAVKRDGCLYPHGPGGSGCTGSGTQVIAPRPESARSHCGHCGVTIFTSYVWHEDRGAWVATRAVEQDPPVSSGPPLDVLKAVTAA